MESEREERVCKLYLELSQNQAVEQKSYLNIGFGVDSGTIFC